MSRVVPLDKPLADRDRQHLRNLGSTGAHLEKRIDAEFPPDPEKLAAFERSELARLAKLNGTGLAQSEQSILMDENDALRRRVAELEAMLKPEPEDESKPPSYDGWSKAQLEAEIDRVNAEDPEAKLPKGKVVDMVTALSAYFAE